MYIEMGLSEVIELHTEEAHNVSLILIKASSFDQNKAVLYVSHGASLNAGVTMNRRRMLTVVEDFLYGRQKPGFTANLSFKHHNF